MKESQCVFLLIVLLIFNLTACESEQKIIPSQNIHSSEANEKFSIERLAQFNEPWALQELPNGQLLVTEKSGLLKLFNPSTKQYVNVLNVPKVAYGGQGGLGDVVLHPEFKKIIIFI